MGTPRLEMWLCEGPADLFSAFVGEPYSFAVKEGAGAQIETAAIGQLTPVPFATWLTTKAAAMVTAIGAPATCGVDANGYFFVSNNTSTSYYFSPTLAKYLGWNIPAGSYLITPTVTGTGVQTAPNKGRGHRTVWNIKIDAPRPVEEVSFREYRHGRAVAYTGIYGKVSRVEMTMDAADADDILSGPLLSGGKVRLYPDGVTATPFSAAAPGGYADVTPLEKPTVERFGFNDSQARMIVECGWEN